MTKLTKENECNLPDFIVARYLVSSLDTLLKLQTDSINYAEEFSINMVDKQGNIADQ